MFASLPSRPASRSHDDLHTPLAGPSDGRADAHDIEAAPPPPGYPTSGSANDVTPAPQPPAAWRQEAARSLGGVAHTPIRRLEILCGEAMGASIGLGTFLGMGVWTGIAELFGSPSIFHPQGHKNTAAGAALIVFSTVIPVIPAGGAYIGHKAGALVCCDLPRRSAA